MAAFWMVSPIFTRDDNAEVESVAKSSPKKVYAIAHQRGTSLPEALGELPSDVAVLIGESGWISSMPGCRCWMVFMPICH